MASSVARIQSWASSGMMSGGDDADPAGLREILGEPVDAEVGSGSSSS